MLFLWVYLFTTSLLVPLHISPFVCLIHMWSSLVWRIQDGSTPLLIAVRASDDAIVAMLLAAGASASYALSVQMLSRFLIVLIGCAWYRGIVGTTDCSLSYSSGWYHTIV